MIAAAAHNPRRIQHTVRDWQAERRLGAIRLTKLAVCLADLPEAELGRADVLRVAGLVVDGGYFQPATDELARQCESGNRAASAAAGQLLSPTVLHAVQAEMQPASRVRLLREIGAYRLEEADGPVSFLTSVVSPVALVLVGIVVGGCCCRCFCPC